MSNLNYQLDFIDTQPRCFVAGLGSVGSFLAVGLHKIGARLAGCDPDTTEEGNLHCQFYGSVGYYKATSLLEFGNFLPCKVEEYPEVIHTDFFFICFDGETPSYAIDTVERLVQERKISSEFFIYPTVGGEFSRILIFNEHIDLVARMFRNKPKVVLPCTSRGVIDMSFLAAGLAINTMRRILKGEIEVPSIIIYDARNLNIVNMKLEDEVL